MAASRSGPGAIVWVHPITIAIGLAGVLCYAVWELAHGEPGAWLRGGTALVVAAFLVAYLRSLRGTLAKRLTPGRSAEG